MSRSTAARVTAGSGEDPVPFAEGLVRFDHDGSAFRHRISLVSPGPVVQAVGMKGVFDVKLGSGYNDDIARRYH